MTTEFFPTQKLSIALDRNQRMYVRYVRETGTMETKVKVLKYMLSVTNSVRNLRQWGCKPRSSYHLKKA